MKTHRLSESRSIIGPRTCSAHFSARNFNRLGQEKDYTEILARQSSSEIPRGGAGGAIPDITLLPPALLLH